MTTAVEDISGRSSCPVHQCVHYCFLSRTRYGFLITDKQLVILRVREEEVGPGLANSRPRRVQQPQPDRSS